MKKYICPLLLICASLPFIVVGQEPAMHWLRSFSGNSEVLPNVTKQLDGGFIVGIESTSNSCNIDSLYSAPNADETIFLKYNSDASILEWHKCYNSSIYGYMFSTANDDYVFGGIGSGSTHYFCIHKEDTSGSVMWSKSYGDGAEALLSGIIATADGGYIMTGTTYYTSVDFPVHYGSWMDEDIAVIKVDSNGNKMWSRVIGGSLPDIPGSIVNAPGDGCYIIGTTLSNDHDFTSNNGGDDAFLIRIDNNGNILWIDCIGGSGGDQANCGVANGSGGVLITGASNSLDGDRTVFPPYGCPIWALEVDSNRNLLWNNCYGGGGLNCYPNAICKATDGSLWIAGVSTLKGGQVDTAYGRDDAFFLHVDSVGNFINSKVLGSRSDDRGTMVYSLPNESIIAGGFHDAGDGDFSTIPYVGSGAWYDNAFLAIFDPWPAGVPQINSTRENINIYPNPAVTSLTITSSEKITNLIITNLLGQTVSLQTAPANCQLLQVDVSDWPRGVYLVKVNGTAVRKFLKE